MSADGRNFDDLFERLADRVHRGPKGQLRLRASLRQLAESVPQLSYDTLRILDVGAGLGQVSLRLAARGHDVTALDVSERMIAHIAVQAAAQSLTLRCIHGSLQSQHARLRSEEPGFDLICCHASLEWMSHPETVVNLFCSLLSQDGALSLLFYNDAALVHRNLLRGNFRRARSPDQSGTKGGLTPTRPLALQTVSQWLDAAGFRSTAWFGVRAILDFLPPALVEQRGLDAIAELERWLEQREPHWRLSRYLHVVARR